MSEYTSEKVIDGNQKCPSCGVPYGDHMGMIGTCAKLQKAIKALEKIKKQHFIKGLAYKAANEALKEIGK